MTIVYVTLLILQFTVQAVVSTVGEHSNKNLQLDSSSSEFVGGTNIATNVPFMVWLEGGCSATLVHQDVALTAAHCSKWETAHVGFLNLNKKDGSSRARIDRVVRHPSYDNTTYKYDFALIKLSAWFQDNKVIQLNRSNKTPRAGDELTILGFVGQSETLQQGVVQILSPSACRLARNEYEYMVREELVSCAQSMIGVDACLGSSIGGPLLDGSVQIGVVSCGLGCNGHLPTITTYSRVSAVIDWIEDQICELSSLPPSSCPDGTFGTARMRIDVVLDEHPEDIEWRIQRGSILGETIASGGTYSNENTKESTFVDLDDGTYVFTIEDIGGFSDGLGRSGSFEVVEVNSHGSAVRTLVTGRSFSQIDSTVFVLGDQLPTFQAVTDATDHSNTLVPSLNVTNIPNAITPQPFFRPVVDLPSQSEPTWQKSTSPLEVMLVTASHREVPSDSETKDHNEVFTDDSLNFLVSDRRKLEDETGEPSEFMTESPTDEPTDAPTFSPTVAPLFDSPTDSPTNVQDDGTVVPSMAPSISVAPSTVPSISVTPSTQPTGTMDPSSDMTSSPASMIPTSLPSGSSTLSMIPTESSLDTSSVSLSPSKASSSSPTMPQFPSGVTEVPSVSPSGNFSPSLEASQAPTLSRQPTLEPNPSNTTDFPSVSNTNTTLQPFPTAFPSTVAPTVNVGSNTTVAPSYTPTSPSEPSISFSPSTATNATTSTTAPSVLTSDESTESPTMPLERYIIAVSLFIVTNPEEISWRVVDFESKVQQFGYRPGWYESTGFSVSTVILFSGTWELVLSRALSAANAILDFGILDPESGLIENIATLDLEDPDGQNEATANFFLD